MVVKSNLNSEEFILDIVVHVFLWSSEISGGKNRDEGST